jgi:hypothetical protein
MRRRSPPPLAALLSLSVLLLPAAALAEGPAPLAVSAGFFGETLLHPGGRVGADVTLAEAGGHRLLAAGNLAGYVHRGHSVGLLADVEAGYRFTFDSGFFCEARLGAGYLHTFLAGDVYARGTDGQFRPVALAGQAGFAPSQSVGLGFDLSRRGGAPLGVFLRLGAFEQFPFNSGWNVHLTSQLGLTWRLGQAR